MLTVWVKLTTWLCFLPVSTRFQSPQCYYCLKCILNSRWLYTISSFYRETLPVIVYVWQQLVNNLWFGYKYARSFHIIVAVVYRYKEKHTHKQTKDHNWVSLDLVDLVLECSCSCMSTVVSVTALSVLVEAYFCILYSEACGDSKEACSETLDVLQLLTFLGDSGPLMVSFPVSNNWWSLSSTAPRSILHGSPNSLWRIADERKI